MAPARVSLDLRDPIAANARRPTTTIIPHAHIAMRRSHATETATVWMTERANATLATPASVQAIATHAHLATSSIPTVWCALPQTIATETVQ